MKKNNSSYFKTSVRVRRKVGPARLARPAHIAFVWGSLIGIWLISLLPWRLWVGSPDILLLVIAFWCMHEPSRVNMLTAFLFGILMDVHDAALMGEHALYYTLIVYGVIVLSRRLQRFGIWIQTLHLLPLFFIAQLITITFQSCLVGNWPALDWLFSGLLTAGLWPLATWLLQLFQRSAEDTEPASV